MHWIHILLRSDQSLVKPEKIIWTKFEDRKKLYLTLGSKLLLFLGYWKPFTLLFEDNFQKLLYLDIILSTWQREHYMYSTNYLCHFLEFPQPKVQHYVKMMTFYVHNNFPVVFLLKDGQIHYRELFPDWSLTNILI